MKPFGLNIPISKSHRANVCLKCLKIFENVSKCLKMKPFGLNNLSLKVSPSECLFKKDQYWQRQSFKRWESLCDMKCISVYGEIMVGSGTGCFKKWLREFWGLYCTVNYTGLDITLLGNVLFWSFFLLRLSRIKRP